MPLFDRARFFDLPRHVARMLLDLRDISSSLFWFLTVQTWLTLWSFLITLISGVLWVVGSWVLGLGGTARMRLPPRPPPWSSAPSPPPPPLLPVPVDVPGGAAPQCATLPPRLHGGMRSRCSAGAMTP